MRRALASLPGVANKESVKADISTETATVTVEKGKFDAAKAAEALAKEGFKGSKVIKTSSPEPEGDT